MSSIKDLKRMCRCHEECNNCPLFIGGFAQCNPNDFPDNVDELIDNWVQENPVKTYASDFLTKLPNAQMDRDRIPKVCRNLIYGVYGDICPKQCNIVSSCDDCWNMEMIE